MNFKFKNGEDRNDVYSSECMRGPIFIYIVFQIFIYIVFLFIWNIIDKALKKYYMGPIFILWRGSQVPVPYFQTFDWGPGVSLLNFQGGRSLYKVLSTYWVRDVLRTFSDSLKETLVKNNYTLSLISWNHPS